jgi:hypothetical protein
VIRRTPITCVGAAVLAAIFVGGCTHSTPPKVQHRTTGPTATISAAPGSTVYRYTNEGLTATVVLRGASGTLEIDNRTGHEVGKPDVYVLNAVDGHRVDGAVSGAVSLPNDSDRSFPVSLGDVEVKDIGLLVLLLGRDNYGAFVEQPSG